MDRITIAGKEYRVEVNWRSILAFMSLKDTDSMECLASLSVPDWVELMCMCIIEGERLDGNDVSKTIGDEVFRLRPGEVVEAITAFTRIYSEQSTAKLPAEPKKD